MVEVAAKQQRHKEQHSSEAARELERRRGQGRPSARGRRRQRASRARPARAWCRGAPGVKGSAARGGAGGTRQRRAASTRGSAAGHREGRGWSGQGRQELREQSSRRGNGERTIVALVAIWSYRTSATLRARRCKKHKHLRPVTMAAAKPSSGRSMATVAIRYEAQAVGARWGKYGGAHIEAREDSGKPKELGVARIERRTVAAPRLKTTSISSL